MSPIRIGIIGLSTTATTSWASSAHLPYLKASNGKYAITALCNTSVDSAKKAIKAYGLPATTKAYSNPEDLAADRGIDLVVCSVRVDAHYPSVKPAILAGKAVYVEWPLASSVAQSSELYNLAQERDVRTMIALQGRVSPIIQTLKSILESDRIGPVLSSTIAAVSAAGDSDKLSSGLAYFLDRKVGGNAVTIVYGHMIDYVHHVLGEFSSFQAHSAIVQKEIQITQSPDGKVLETVKSDVPDFLTVHGTLEGSNAPLAITFQRRQPFKGTPGFMWYITGSKGEIRITSPKPILQAYDIGTEILVEDYASRTVQKVEWKSEFADLPPTARNIAALYEAFAKGETGYPDLGLAERRSKEIEEVFRSADEGRVGRYL